MSAQFSKQKSQYKHKKLRYAILTTINEHYPISSSQLRYRINAANKNFSGYQEEYITNFIKHHLEDEISIFTDMCENSSKKSSDKSNTIIHFQSVTVGEDIGIFTTSQFRFCPKNMPANINSTDRLVRSRSSLSRRQQFKTAFDGSDIDAFIKVLSTLKTKNGEPVSWTKIRTQYSKITGRSLTLEELNKIAETNGLSRKAIIETKLHGLLSSFDKKCDNVVINHILGSGDTGFNKENSTPVSRVSTNFNSREDGLRALKQPLEYVKNNHDKIVDEITFYETEIELRGGNHVPLVDLAIQYTKDSGNKALVFDAINYNTEGSRDIIISMVASKFKINVSDNQDISLSLKDLDFDMDPSEDSSSIDKPCSLEHEKEIENNLEAIVAGGDILIDDDNNKENISNQNIDTYNGLSFTEHLNAIGTEDPSDALEIFICSRLQSLIEDGMESIPISNLENLINDFFEMKVDPLREFGCNWEGVAEKFIKRNFFYYTLDKKGLVLKDPTTPEVYEEHVKIPSDYSCSSASDSDNISPTENFDQQFVDVSPASDYDSVGDIDILNDENDGFEKTLLPMAVENIRKEKFEKISAEMVNIFDNDTKVETLPSIDIKTDTIINDKTIKIDDVKEEDDKIVNENDVTDVTDTIENEEKPLLKVEGANTLDQNDDKALDNSTDKSEPETCKTPCDNDQKKKLKSKKGKSCCCTIC